LFDGSRKNKYREVAKNEVVKSKLLKGKNSVAKSIENCDLSTLFFQSSLSIIYLALFRTFSYFCLLSGY